MNIWKKVCTHQSHLGRQQDSKELSPRSLNKMLLKLEINSQTVQSTQLSKLFQFSKSSKFSFTNMSKLVLDSIWYELLQFIRFSNMSEKVQACLNLFRFNIDMNWDEMKTWWNTLKLNKWHDDFFFFCTKKWFLGSLWTSRASRAIKNHNAISPIFLAHFGRIARHSSDRAWARGRNLLKSPVCMGTMVFGAKFSW